MHKHLLSILSLSISASYAGLIEQMDAYMMALTELNRFNGTVVVAKGDTVLLNKGYGSACFEWNVPNSPDTYYRICSISKMITAVAILQLAEQGQLKLDAALSTYLNFPRANEITIHHLLTHTSGISGCSIPVEMAVVPTPLETLLGFYKDKPLECSPGTDFYYSNAGYYILSSIIEKVTGKKFETYIKEFIAEPSGMSTGSLNTSEYAIVKNTAFGYCYSEHNELVQAHYSYGPNFSGAGGLSFTAYDLYVFSRALVTGQVLNKNSLNSMFTIYHPKQNYGYGCSIESLLNHRCILHNGGSSNGFRSNITHFIHDDITIVLLSNVLSSWVNDAREALAAIIFEKPHIVPSANTLSVDPSFLDNYSGTYDHPLFTDSNYTIIKKERSLYTPESVELVPVGIDQFCQKGHHKNLVYTFMRNDKGVIDQLHIKGGSRFYEIRCPKKL